MRQQQTSRSPAVDDKKGSLPRLFLVIQNDFCRRAAHYERVLRLRGDGARKRHSERSTTAADRIGQKKKTRTTKRLFRRRRRSDDSSSRGSSGLAPRLCLGRGERHANARRKNCLHSASFFSSVAIHGLWRNAHERLGREKGKKMRVENQFSATKKI